MTQRRSDTGASMVEYALIIAAFMTALIITLPWLLDTAADHFEEKASAISG